MNEKERRKEIQNILNENSWLKEVNNRINRLAGKESIFDEAKVRKEKISPEQIIDIYNDLDQMDDEICREANKLQEQGINSEKLEVKCNFVRSLRACYIMLFEIKYPDRERKWSEPELKKILDDMDLALNKGKIKKWGIDN